ncbi:hypothetical protein [Actinomadura macrotermitis]|uniref:SRPBCC family protein n=1 Tax=Actinomadura macrotermitis TaxID=2585200 RepID=A0A7K0BY47_9ACTN|nr:hypothetical protein [Actinomadura macrotermitis]MQY05554.1 hypothetical protein [Actinomadura macrotermitis]
MTDRLEPDPVQRLRVMAAGIPGAHVTERVVPAPFDVVWGVMADLEGEFGSFQPDMKSVRVTHRRDDRLEVLAHGHLGFRARFDVVLRPGWCWMQSRFLLIGMAAVPAGDRTRVALTGGTRVPGRAAIVPIRVRHETERAMLRLAQRVAER